jgi:hypothetical protein
MTLSIMTPTILDLMTLFTNVTMKNGTQHIDTYHTHTMTL